ncbi:hypothetical protein RJ641_016817 [Dillenia turbinata]|uniref:Uncharacterized protein n=1 Tax=Dillenia turbinata TaxID=194707 RepID=A0AAN8UMQ2_9MAGN
MKNLLSGESALVFLILMLATSFIVEAQVCRPSGKIRGVKPPSGQCNKEDNSVCCIKGKLYMTYKCSPPVTIHTKAFLTLNSFEKGGDGRGERQGYEGGGHRSGIDQNMSNSSRLSLGTPKAFQTAFDASTILFWHGGRCSPPASSHTKATLTLNSFEKNGDGGAPLECDNHYHSDDTPVVALSTGSYNHGNRCLKHIKINGNGRSVIAKVVDECDSTMGCDSDHDYRPPYPNNIVDASKAVWEALGVPSDQQTEMEITWSDHNKHNGRMKNLGYGVSILMIAILLLSGEAQSCSPSGTIRGKKTPPGKCNTENDS